jgi:hypothetical protein
MPVLLDNNPHNLNLNNPRRNKRQLLLLLSHFKSWNN